MIDAERTLVSEMKLSDMTQIELECNIDFVISEDLTIDELIMQLIEEKSGEVSRLDYVKEQVEDCSVIELPKIITIEDEMKLENLLHDNFNMSITHTAYVNFDTPYNPIEF